MEKSLFRISAEMQELTNELIDNGGELTPEIEKSLEISNAELETKSTGYSVVIRSLKYENDVINQEIKRLQSLKKSRENTIEKLKNALEYSMSVFGIEEIKTEMNKINFRKSSSLEILDVDKVPNKYKTLVTDIKIDKNQIKKDLKDGVEIAGVQLLENKNLQIK